MAWRKTGLYRSVEEILVMRGESANRAVTPPALHSAGRIGTATGWDD